MQLCNVTDELQRSAFEFFFHFSRFEYALKANGFFKNWAACSNAEADWNAFVEKFKKDYSPCADALTLIKLAPKKQIVIDNDELGWADLRFGTTAFELEKVSRYLKAARNNLFHGGKMGGGGWDDSARNIDIVSTATKVLFSLAELGTLMNDFKCEY